MTVPSTTAEVTIGLGGSGTVKIEWGDGTSSTKTLSKEAKYYQYTYPSSNTNRTLKITGNTVTYISCAKMDLTSLDVTKSPDLKNIECQYNKLTALDISKNTALKILYCQSNELTALDVSKNTALTHLFCGVNKLTALDVSKNTELGYFYGNKNSLTALDVSKNIKLNSIDCGKNNLTVLDLTYNTKLSQVSCPENNLTAAALNTLCGSLHNNVVVGMKNIHITGNQGANDCDKSIATAKGWLIY